MRIPIFEVEVLYLALFKIIKITGIEKLSWTLWELKTILYDKEQGLNCYTMLKSCSEMIQMKLSLL